MWLLFGLLFPIPLPSISLAISDSWVGIFFSNHGVSASVSRSSIYSFVPCLRISRSILVFERLSCIIDHIQGIFCCSDIQLLPSMGHSLFGWMWPCDWLSPFHNFLTFLGVLLGHFLLRQSLWRGLHSDCSILIPHGKFLFSFNFFFQFFFLHRKLGLNFYPFDSPWRSFFYYCWLLFLLRGFWLYFHDLNLGKTSREVKVRLGHLFSLGTHFLLTIAQWLIPNAKIFLELH